MYLDQKILQRLNEIGIALSKEHRIPVLLEKILIEAKEITGADGGTIYTVTEQGMLHFEIAMSDSLQFHLGGTSQRPVPFKDLPLVLPDGTKNDTLMVAYAVNHNLSINIKDAYHEEGFDFSGTRRFDEQTGYRTKAVLTIPIHNHEERVIAVLQLINPLDKKAFAIEDVQLAESLASQAGVVLTNQLLINSLRKLFESLIRVIAEAIDEKSPSTGNHGKRVPVIALQLAEAVNQTNEGPFKEVHFSKEELYELKVAAFLHDCGKITTPIHLVEKRYKLETIFDRFELIQTRFQLYQERLEKEYLIKKIEAFETQYPKEFEDLKEKFSVRERELQVLLRRASDDLELIHKVNTQEIFIDEAVQQRLQEIAHQRVSDAQPLITTNELENLSIVKGNLTAKEREQLEQHVVMTYRMLSQLDFPKELRQVPEIASSHHERVDGMGYPRGLTKEEMLIQSRILAIADIFEALSAPDRSYKEALSLSQVLSIMEKMVQEGHLDADLFEIFKSKKVYLTYAKQYLSPEQIDI